MQIEIPYNKLIIGNTYYCKCYNLSYELTILDIYKIGEIIFVRTANGPSHFQVFPNSTCTFFPLDQLNTTEKDFNYNQKPSYVYKLDL
jgi:hypothetical protein